MNKQEIIEQVSVQVQMKVLDYVYNKVRTQLNEKVSRGILYTMEEKLPFEVWEVVRNQVGDLIRAGPKTQS